MQDPSAGVQQPLDKHVHLISSHSFPVVAQVNLEQAFRWLLEAPPVVKQVAPMSWTYVNPPQDGTIWLEWLSPAQNGGRFPSDGYIWADPEQSFRQNVNGYTVEVLMHQAGFRPGVDHMTTHARTRYHLVAKAPNINAAAPDPSLWIVHYHHAPQQRIMPASQVNIDQYTRHIINERGWLERQGRIERRDFMLHDREHWPTITTPSAQQTQMQHPAYYNQGAAQNPAMMAQNRYGQPPYPQPAGVPSAKRQRIQGPGPMAGPPEIAGQDYGVEDEEYTVLGDYFDHLTPREISLTRFQQHHSWMEEVFQSPHAMHNIIPVDLGLGLMGELKGLTDGILQAPALDELLDKDATTNENSAAFTSLSQEQLYEFNTRVQKHIEEGKAEMERMKAEHAERMREWRNTHKLTRAEGQLRAATWQGHESALFRATEENSDEQAKVEDVIDSVERLVQLKVKPHVDATLVEKGGLQRVEQQTLDGAVPQQSKLTGVAAAPESSAFDQDMTNGPAETSNEHKTAPALAEQPSTSSSTQLPGAEAAAVAPQADELDMLNDSMELDGGALGFELDETNLNRGGGGGGATEPAADSTATAMQSGPSDVVAGKADTTAANATSNNTQQTGGEAAMFNNSNFEFDNELGAGGDGVGDGMIDFGEDDGLGMDDSAFGDALHGMDS